MKHLIYLHFDLCSLDLLTYWLYLLMTYSLNIYLTAGSTYMITADEMYQFFKSKHEVVNSQPTQPEADKQTTKTKSRSKRKESVAKQQDERYKRKSFGLDFRNLCNFKQIIFINNIWNYYYKIINHFIIIIIINYLIII